MCGKRTGEDIIPLERYVCTCPLNVKQAPSPTSTSLLYCVYASNCTLPCAAAQPFHPTGTPHACQQHAPCPASVRVRAPHEARGHVRPVAGPDQSHTPPLVLVGSVRDSGRFAAREVKRVSGGWGRHIVVVMAFGLGPQPRKAEGGVAV